MADESYHNDRYNFIFLNLILVTALHPTLVISSLRWSDTSVSHFDTAFPSFCWSFQKSVSSNSWHVLASQSCGPLDGAAKLEGAVLGWTWLGSVIFCILWPIWLKVDLSGTGSTRIIYLMWSLTSNRQAWFCLFEDSGILITESSPELP